MILRTLLLALALSQPLAAQELPALFNVTGVAASDVLNIRAEPSASAAIVGTIAPDALGIEVVAMKGDWALINHSQGQGYVAASFLAHDGKPNWSELTTTLYCSGTEPFWLITFDPAASRATFDMFDGEPSEWAVKMTWPRSERSDLVAIDMGDKIAVLRPQECSDGMSDTAFGIAFDMLITDDMGGGYQGCCSLVGL